jgi:hypothetical protein
VSPPAAPRRASLWGLRLLHETGRYLHTRPVFELDCDEFAIGQREPHDPTLTARPKASGRIRRDHDRVAVAWLVANLRCLWSLIGVPLTHGLRIWVRRLGECLRMSPEPRGSAQKTKARSPRFFDGNFNVPRLARTNKRRPVDEVVVNTRVCGPIQNPITCLGTRALALGISTTLWG